MNEGFVHCRLDFGLACGDTFCFFGFSVSGALTHCEAPHLLNPWSGRKDELRELKSSNSESTEIKFILDIL